MSEIASSSNNDREGAAQPVLHWRPWHARSNGS